MSLLPYLIEAELYPQRRLLDQHFGLQTPSTLLCAVDSPLAVSRDYYRPWRQLQAAVRDVGSSIISDKNKFEVHLDVQQFSPEEITVKTANGYIVVEGKHEEKQDEHGYISRQFTRRYVLPKDCAPEAVESRLSSDGVLTVTAPRASSAIADQRTVNVQQTGPVRRAPATPDQQDVNK